MKKFQLALPITLVALAIITMACSNITADATQQPNTTPPTPIAVPGPTSTAVPQMPTPAAPPSVPPTETATLHGLNQGDLDTLQAELNWNVEKWQQTGPSDYTFEFRVNCFCPSSITSPVNITVRNTNTIESVSFVESGEPVTENLEFYLTVDEMFDMLQKAIDMRVASLTVSYDSEMGYPTNVFIDRDFTIVDEERGFVVSSLRPIESPTLDEIQSQLNASRELWESSGLSDYEIQYHRACFCPPDITAPVIVSVSNGVIDSLTYAETGEPVSETVRDLFPAVPGMFDVVQDAIDRDAARIRVSYEPSLGYPVSIAIDYDTMIVDEELGFSVSSFK